MKNLLSFLIISIIFLQLPAQSWRELYDSTEAYWETDWEACEAILEKAIVAAREEFGEQDSNYAKTANQLGECYYYLGKYSEAADAYTKSIISTKESLGRQHPDYSRRLQNLGYLYYEVGQYQQALTLLEKALEYSSQVFGEDDPEYAFNLNYLGLVYEELEQFEQSLACYQKARNIIEYRLGKESEEYGLIINNLGALYQNLGKYSLALPLYKEAVNNAKRNLGDQHPDYGISLNNLGTLYQLMNQHELALDILQESLLLTKQSKGIHHQEYGVSLYNLAITYKSLGNYEEALLLLEESLENTRENLGTRHIQYATTLLGMSQLYKLLGNYNKALPILYDALSIVEESLGTEDSRYGRILSELGSIHITLGNYEQAQDLLLDAQSKYLQNLGKYHPFYINTTHNLAEVYTKRRKYDLALTNYNNLIATLKEEQKLESLEYGFILSGLGSLYAQMQDYEQAIDYFQQAKIHTEKFGSKQSLAYLIQTNNLGTLYSHIGQYDQALKNLKDAVFYIRESLGDQHELYGFYLGNLGVNYVKMDSLEQAQKAFIELAEILELHIKSQAVVMNASLQASFLSTKKFFFDRIASFIVTHPEYGELRQVGFNQQLLLKAFLQTNQAELLRGLQNHPDPLIKREYDQWLGLHRILALQYQNKVNERLASFDSIQNKANELEIQLSSKSLEFRKVRKLAHWQDIQKKLKPGEAVIEFSHFQYWNRTVSTDSILYIAYVLTSQDSFPSIIPLFEERQLTQLYLQHHSQKKINQFYSSRGIKPRKNQIASEHLYQMLWQPLNSVLEEIHTIYYAPSGLLHRINFGAIANKKETLLDRYKLVQLSSTRELILEEEREDKQKDALVLGGIYYDLDSTYNTLPLTTSFSDSIAEKTLSPSISNNSRGNTAWQFLSGTATEANQISDLLLKKGYEVNLKTGFSATEASVKSMNISPRVLHIATHGYFFPDPKDTTIQSLLDLNQQSAIQLSEHPLVRSGLILTGGNYAWKGNSIPNGQEDGILTAYEISQMNLSNTELVVLSACETGLGDIEGNEGVYGLQRAFKIAGARYLIMSLWQVPDKETMEFMTTFYRNWLEEEMEIPEAFRATQKAMRKKYEEPYKWAGFVLVE